MPVVFTPERAAALVHRAERPSGRTLGTERPARGALGERNAHKERQRFLNCGAALLGERPRAFLGVLGQEDPMPSLVSILNASFSCMPSVSRIVRRIACTASGPLFSMTSAISSALVSACPVGHDVADQAHVLASAAVMCRPVSSRSHATV